MKHGEQGIEEKEAARPDSDDVEEDPLPCVDMCMAPLEPNHKAVFFTNLLVEISTKTNRLCQIFLQESGFTMLRSSHLWKQALERCAKISC